MTAPSPSRSATAILFLVVAACGPSPEQRRAALLFEDAESVRFQKVQRVDTLVCGEVSGIVERQRTRYMRFVHDERSGVAMLEPVSRPDDMAVEMGDAICHQPLSYQSSFDRLACAASGETTRHRAMKTEFEDMARRCF